MFIEQVAADLKNMIKIYILSILTSKHDLWKLFFRKVSFI